MGSGVSKKTGANKHNRQLEHHNSGYKVEPPRSAVGQYPPSYGFNENVTGASNQPGIYSLQPQQQPPNQQYPYPQTQGHNQPYPLGKIQPQGHYPPQQQQQQVNHSQEQVGSASSVSKTDPTMFEPSEERDRIYMMVLSADEFLGKLDETDVRIRTLSKADERDLHRKTIQELFGLRGHLQDELLRIEQMLAKDDPKLKCLDFLSHNYPMVVNKLRELRKKEQIVKAKVIQEELPPSLGNLAQGQGTVGLQAGAGGTDSGTQAGGSGGTDTGTQSSGTGTISAATVTEDDLKDKHEQEEKQVAENYADRLVNKQRLTQEDVDSLLQDHALSMQALRKRQEEERQSIKERLEKKLYNRKNKTMYGHDPDEEDEDNSRTSSPSNSAQKSDPFLSGNESDESDNEGDNKVLRDTMWNKMSISRRVTAENLKDMVESYTKEEDKRKSRNSKKSQLPPLQEHSKSMVSIGVDVNSNHSTISMGTDASPLTTGGVSMATGTSDSDTEEVKEILKDDEEIIKDFLSKRADGMSPEDFSRFMEDHLRDKEKLRKLKEYERQKLKDKLKNKLGEKNKGRPGSGRSRTSDSEDSDSSVNKDRKKMTSKYMTMLNDEEDKELQNLKEEFLSTLTKKKREGISESEMEKLLEEYRRRQRQIIKDKEHDRRKHQDKMKVKLEERLRQKKMGNGPSSPIHTGEQGEDDDSAFFEKLQRMQINGELTKDEFSDMLKNYLDKKRQLSRRKRLDNRNEESDKQAASELVNEFNKQKQEVHGIRMAEKDKMDAKLKRRLQSNRNKKLKNYGDNDTSHDISHDNSYLNSSKDDSQLADADYEF